MFGGGTKAGTAPPSSWRFHSSGFATGSNAEMAVVGRQPHNAAAASSSSTAFASTTTTTTTTMDTTLLAPHPPGDHHLRGGGGGWGGGGANKRPLASCREELDNGWHRHRCVSNDRVSSSWLADDDDDDDDEIITDDDDIADDGDMSSGNGNGNGNGNGRVKRRRISSPPIRDRAGGMMEGEEDAAAMMNTTTTDDRGSSSSSTMTWTDGSPSLVVTRRAVRIARRDPRRQVKAGWYDGPVDDYGNRHGRGTTRHDDGTTYEGPYANDVMAGSGGRYTLPARHELAGDDNLLRRVEVRFEGSFRDDAPHGVGATITTTVDRVAPSAGGRPARTEVASPATVVVTYDVGVHDSRKSGAVGEGARVAYRRIVRPPDDGFCHRPDAYGGGGGGGGTGTTGGVAPPPPPPSSSSSWSSSSSSSSSSWERSCYRLINGGDAGMKVADGYAAWIVQCMGVDFPGPPSPLLLAPTSATPASS